MRRKDVKTIIAYYFEIPDMRKGFTAERARLESEYDGLRGRRHENGLGYLYTRAREARPKSSSTIGVSSSSSPSRSSALSFHLLAVASGVPREAEILAQLYRRKYFMFRSDLYRPFSASMHPRIVASSAWSTCTLTPISWIRPQALLSSILIASISVVARPLEGFCFCMRVNTCHRGNGDCRLFLAVSLHAFAAL